MKSTMLSVIIVMALAAAPASATVIRVPADQPTIQAGIDAAMIGDTVLVSDGIYTGDGNRDIDFGGKSILVRSKNGPEACIIDCQADAADQHRGFYFHTGENRDAQIQGFTIRNGYLDQQGQYGGGIMVGGSTSPTIRDNVITSCYSEYGGAIACFSTVNPLIIDNRIENNQADYGGGFYGAPSSRPEIISNTVSGNAAIVACGGIQCRGDNSVIVSNTVSANTSQGTVGGFAVTSDYAVVTGNMVAGNSSVTWVGGMSVAGRETLAAGNVVVDNQTDGDVGGMAFGADAFGMNGVMINNLVAGNIAGGNGGGVQLRHSESMVTGNTIAHNQAGINAGALLILDSYFSDSVVTMTNNLIWGNTAPSGYQIEMGYSDWYSPPELHISHSTLEGGQAAIDTCTGCVVVWGGGMLESDPIFLDGSDGSYYLSQTAAGQPDQSPCVDAGNDAAANISFTTPDGEISLADLTTRTDQLGDEQIVDLGYHYAWKTAAASLSCLPGAGTLPFQTMISADMTNLYAGFSRTLAARINIELAGGQTYGNWRTGHANIGPDDSLVTSWAQTIPALPSVVGLNRFTLVVVDVTPAPYNQPPYPPSGDVDTDGCEVIGLVQR